MFADGGDVQVDWYFVPEDQPILDKVLCKSINWERPTYGTAPIGEVIGAPRRWRDGSVPEYVGFDAAPGNAHPIAGLPDWWLSGAPRAHPQGLRWDGSRGFTDNSGPGLFPPPQTSFLYKLVSSVHGRSNVQASWLFSPYQGWGWIPDAGYLIGFAPLPKLGHCFPGLLTLSALKPGSFVSGTLRPLRCVAVAGDVSVWDDPPGTSLATGETLTLSPLP